MASDEPNSIRTRSSLLNRLKAGDDTDSWQEFYRIYGKLVRDFAIQAGLTDAEADDVVQETTIAMARHLPAYRYDPKVCRFKTWLLNQASWRVRDHFKKRKKEAAWTACYNGQPGSEPKPSGEDTSRTSTIHRVPDAGATDLDAVFEAEWQKNLFAAALERVRGKFSLKQFQVFDLLVSKEWPAGEVARSLDISVANVYVTRHRISAAIKKEIRRLESQLEQAARCQSEGRMRWHDGA
jgi:RNA polymerase sigma-70 factor (ECF subfamily)